MRNRFNTPFNKGMLKASDNLPDHVMQEINDLTSKILITALLINKDGESYDPNLSLGAMQKALGLLIANFFKKEQLSEVTKNVCIALTLSIEEYQGDSDEE